jgi:molybdopterin synthase sulfur carrier subunit
MTLLYFAWVRQKVGRGQEEIEMLEGVSTVADLIDWLRARSGGHAEAFADPKRLRVAVNQEHVGFDAPVYANDEVAFFPPVTGG